MQLKTKEFIQNSLLPLSASEIKIDDNLFEFGLDSLKMMKLINFLEDEFKISIPFEKINPTHFSTINTLIELVEQLQKGENAG